MATSGTGVGTPVGGGGGTTSVSASPLPYTHLAPARYAQIMGINPAHFHQAHAPNLSPPVFPVSPNACQGLWFRHDWIASDSISWQSLIHTILGVEANLKKWLGHAVAPEWEIDVLRYPKFYRPEYVRLDGVDVAGKYVGLKAKWGKIVQAGQRSMTLLGSPSVSYSDDDGDGLSETATVSVSATLTNACEVKVYIKDKSGSQEWEIRPARSKSISSGTFTATFWSWQLINPDLWDAFPTSEGPSGIDISTISNFLAEVDVYREYTDSTQTSAELYWEPTCDSLICLCGGTGCVNCQFTQQDGCLHVRDVDNGVVVPQASTYNSSTGQWESTCFTECRDPDQVKLYYYAGDQDTAYLRGASCDPLAEKWAQVIAWMTTARLERPFCGCGNLTALFQKLQTDLAFTGTDSAFQFDPQELANPFGTHVGEVMAWRRVGKVEDRILGVALA